MKKLFLALLIVLSISNLAFAEYFKDIIITGPNGMWVDARAYSSLSDAITAIGADQRTIRIDTEQTVTNLTVPSNITLEFGRDGSIKNSGTLTLQTRNIISPDRQIFTGVGQINFASGTTIRSAWFQNCESALALTSAQTVTLIISKAQTLTASFAVGSGVVLKWEAPNNILTVANGVTISNIKHIEAGNYQIFAGSGTFSFVDDIVLNLSWFANLRAAITWISTTKAVLEVYGTNIVDYTDSVPSTTLISVKSGSLSITAGHTLTIGNFQAPSNMYIFPGNGEVKLPTEARPEWWNGDVTKAVNSLL